MFSWIVTDHHLIVRIFSFFEVEVAHEQNPVVSYVIAIVLNYPEINMLPGSLNVKFQMFFFHKKLASDVRRFKRFRPHTTARKSERTIIALGKVGTTRWAWRGRPVNRFSLFYTSRAGQFLESSSSKT